MILPGDIRRAIVVGFLPWLVVVSWGQQQFDVASIRLSSPEVGRQYTISPTPAGLRATDMSLTMLILWAYRLNDYQLIGAPAWAADHYDIAAKPGASSADLRLMMQHLLTDRFKLRVHQESRVWTEYALKMDKGGSKMKAPADAKCTAGPGSPDNPCGRLAWSGNHLHGRSAPMTMLVFALAQQAGHPVVDETGLQGPFDMEMRWTPENARQPLPDDAPPSIFTALQRQMGLKLEARKGAVQVLVIDHVERPSDN
jgi:uncharacterized protein (TIGR03435 family)